MVTEHIHVYEPLFDDDRGEGLEFCSGLSREESALSSTFTLSGLRYAHSYIAIAYRGELVREMTHISQVPMGRDFRDGQVVRTWIGAAPAIRFKADGRRKDNTKVRVT